MIVREIMAEETYFLRHKILRPHQPIEKCHYPSDRAPGTFHLGAFLEFENVGIISVEPDIHPDFTYQKQFRIRGMAVVPEHRRQKIGAQLVIEAMKILEQRNIEFVWFNAREVAFHFYEQLGFKYHGGVFEIESIGPHRVMYALVKGWSYER